MSDNSYMTMKYGTTYSEDALTNRDFHICKPVVGTGVDLVEAVDTVKVVNTISSNGNSQKESKDQRFHVVDI